MKKYIIIFTLMTFFSLGMIVYGYAFMVNQIGEAALTEKTMEGNREVARDIIVGFRADSSEELHWVNSFEYKTDETKSYFKRGDMSKEVSESIYDEIRFTGWSTIPYCTQLEYEELDNLQIGNVHEFYEEIQKRVKETGVTEEGEIRLKEYLDYYPVSFRFQFGAKTFNSNNALTGLKIYDENGVSYDECGTAYNDDVELYTELNKIFTIPVIENEYHQYTITKIDDYDYKTSLEYETEINKSKENGTDYYEFDPIIVIQEENTMDGKDWGGKFTNRMLFVVNNRTAKGEAVDVSQISKGYGIYELPIEVNEAATIKKGRRSWTLPNPKPLTDELAMVYPLDETAEYVEMSISADHKYLAVFSVKDGMYYLELIDADLWVSAGKFKLFNATETMTYSWGEDGSLTVTNHDGEIAALCRIENTSKPYEMIYSGEIGEEFCEDFFDTEMVHKKNSYAKYKYGIDKGLAIAAKSGKLALVQNLVVDSMGNTVRDASLECAVIDRDGIAYRGVVKSNITDTEDGMSCDEIEDKAVRQMITPVKNWIIWE